MKWRSLSGVELTVDEVERLDGVGLTVYEVEEFGWGRIDSRESEVCVGNLTISLFLLQVIL